MSSPFRSKLPAWIFTLVFALGVVGWIDLLGIKRIHYVSNVAAEDALIDSLSPTGYAKGERWLIVPEHDNATYQWIGDTQQMLADGNWRFHRTHQENVPFGRDVHAASPYRWWLIAISGVERFFADYSRELALEKAVLYANPALHLILFLFATVFVARQFGGASAVVMSVGLAALYPFASSFIPGVANDYSFSEIAGLGTILLLLAGLGPNKNSLPWFFWAGVVGGIGLWIGAATQIIIIEGIFIGGVFAAWLTRPSENKSGPELVPGLPWRGWALGGAITCLLAYLIEYYPDQMDLRFQVNHPIYGLAWLGVGELLHQITRWTREGKNAFRAGNILLTILAGLAVISFPIALKYTGIKGAIIRDLSNFRLSNEPDGVVADNFGAWFTRDQWSFPLVATGITLILLATPIWLLLKRVLDVRARFSITLALGTALWTLVFSFQHLRDWSLFDCALLALLVTTTAALSFNKAFDMSRWVWIGSLSAALLIGLLEMVASAATVKPDRFTKSEIAGLYERAIAHWVAEHTAPSSGVVLVPPYRTASFNFYGGLRGIGSPDWENHDGLAATVRIVSAARSDEAEALVNERGITQIILPSWDPDLSEFGRLASGHAEESFIYKLQHGIVFDWLRPVPYKLPSVGGFDDQSVVIFEVTPDVDRSVSISRLTEYFIEMQQVQFATSGSEALRHYPGDLGALVAVAGVEKERGNTDGFDKVFKSVVSNLSTGSDRNLLWDRRVSLAVILTLGERRDLAQKQVQRCLNEIDADKIRFLTTGTLYHFDVLCKLFGLEISDPKLRDLSRSLLPAEMRGRL